MVHSGKGEFYRDLDKLITAALPSDKLMVTGDLNTRVGKSARMWWGKLLDHRGLHSSCQIKPCNHRQQLSHKNIMDMPQVKNNTFYLFL